MTTNDPLVVAADKYLENRRVVLWAHKTIDRPDDRWDAAIWLAEQVKGVLAEIEK